MRLKIVGSHPQSQGAECVIFGHFGALTHRFEPVSGLSREGGEFSARGKWVLKPMRPGPGADTAPALVGADVNGDACRTTGRLLVLSHSWSGRLQINNVTRRYTVDLYSQATRLVMLDLVNEIVLDVTALAHLENGAIHMPDMSRAVLLRRIVEDRAWFRLIEPDADFNPGLARRAMGWRAPRTEGFKLQILSHLLPQLSAAPVPATPASADPALRDEVRLLAAALEGLALRAPASAQT